MHRVQRVPVTESQGRVHTSAAGVLVMPEAEQVDVTIEEKDLRIDVFRSSGPGGQSVNTTDSAVRITHLPTGIVVELPEREEPAAEPRAGDAHPPGAAARRPPRRPPTPRRRDARRSQVRTVDRSERIRTYNFPENRISDHRTGYKSYNLDQVLDGDLAAVVDLVRGGGPGRPSRGARVRGHVVTDRRLALRAAAMRLAEAGVASPEHDAAELLAHVLGTTRGGARRSATTSPTPSRRSSTRWSTGARPGSRCST